MVSVEGSGEVQTTDADMCSQGGRQIESPVFGVTHVVARLCWQD
jgi:hypothetical protein